MVPTTLRCFVSPTASYDVLAPLLGTVAGLISSRWLSSGLPTQKDAANLGRCSTTDHSTLHD